MSQYNHHDTRSFHVHVGLNCWTAVFFPCRVQRSLTQANCTHVMQTKLKTLDNQTKTEKMSSFKLTAIERRVWHKIKYRFFKNSPTKMYQISPQNRRKEIIWIISSSYVLHAASNMPKLLFAAYFCFELFRKFLPSDNWLIINR